MDPSRFDALVKSANDPTSRRTLSQRVAALGVVVLGRVALRDRAQARKKSRVGKGLLCSRTGSQCRKKGKTCKAGNCLKTPFTIEARWSNPNTDHDTFVFVPNAPGASLPFPYFNYNCRSDDTGAGQLEPFAYVSQDALGPGDEVTTVAFLLNGKYEYWMNLDYPAPAGDLTVALRNQNGNVIRSWKSPANPGQPKRGWHVFDIQGERKSITSINQMVTGTVPQGAHAVAIRVCP
jgi:hypothetical protein